MQTMPGKQFEFDSCYEGENWQGETVGRAKKFGPLYLYQVGELSCINGYEIAPHLQWCHEISYVVSGEGVFTTDNDTNLLLEGDIHFSPKGSTHSIRTGPNSDLRFAYIAFSFAEDSEDEEINKLRDFYDNLHEYKASSHNDFLIPMFRNLDELYNKSEFYQTMVQTYAIQTLITAYRAFLSSPEHIYFPNPPEENVGRAVYTVIKYIDNHIYDKLEIRQIAQDVGYNYSYISNMFHKTTGDTLQRYINNKKIQKAIELMKYGKLSVSQVTKRLEYASVQSFNKAFKRTMGIAPTVFLKETEQANPPEAVV